MTVSLTAPEMRTAGLAGVERMIAALEDGLRGAHGIQPGSEWAAHILGALGECAAAKALGLYWPGRGELRGDDIPGGVQVRTRSQAWHDLILHPRDRDGDIFVLVRQVEGNSFRLVGWIYGRDGKQKRFWSDPAKGRPAFFVPDKYLNNMQSFPRKVINYAA